MDKSPEELKILPRDSASPDGVPDKARGGEELDTGEPFAHTRLDDEEIPGGVEETKVVLLPVNPHLVYAYWEFSDRDREEVNRVFSRFGPRARPVLKFYQTGEAGPGSPKSASEFEVAIALGAGKWYVRLEHPANSYCLDLGLNLAGGSFRLLARSNVAEMPRARASEKTEDRDTRANGDHSPAEADVPQAHAGRPSPGAASGEKPEAAPGGWQEFGEARGTPPAYAEPQGRRENWPEPGGATGPAPANAVRPGEEGIRAALDSAAPYRPSYDEWQGEDPERESEWPPRGESAWEMERQLVEFYQHRTPEWVWWTPGAEGRERPRSAAPRRADLTELSERSFRAGLSSGQK